MNLFNVYIAVGFFYALYMWVAMTPKEDKQIDHLGHVTSFLVQAVGAVMVWPLVVFVNHVWQGPEDDQDGDQ